MEIRERLKKALFSAVNKISKKPVFINEICLQDPPLSNYGDICTNLALRTSIKPEKIVKALKKQKLEFLAKIEVKNNFINFYLKPEFLTKELNQVLKQKDKYGCNFLLKDKKIMVEYAQPNTHKTFHIGHLRNIINGEAVVRILEASGAKVIRVNYQGDVGLHVAKCLYSLRQNRKLKEKMRRLKNLDEKVKLLSQAYVQGNEAYEKDPQAKKEILAINKSIYEKKDKKILKLWQETRQWSLDYFARIYKRVYSHFDRYYFESEVYEKGKKIVLKALKKGIFAKSQGAVIFPASKFGLHDRVFITSQGNPTYEAKDIGLYQLQFNEYQPDLIIHNVGPEQQGYFKVLFKALEQVFPQSKNREYHLVYGWVRLKKGKMSSRKGEVVLAEWFLDEAKKRLKKNYPQMEQRTAEIVAIGAVKYSFLKVALATEVAFDFKESISLEGNSGPYLQYTYARTQSVMQKAQKNFSSFLGQLPQYLPNKEELSILRSVNKFSSIVKEAAKNYSPNLIANYLYELCQRYNTFYNKHRIINQKTQNSDGKTQFRLLLTKAVSQIIKNGLYLLGIKTAAKM